MPMHLYERGPCVELKREVVVSGSITTLYILSSLVGVVSLWKTFSFLSTPLPFELGGDSSVVPGWRCLRDTPLPSSVQKFFRALKVWMESIFCAKSVDHGGKKATKERRQRLVVLAVTITSRSPVCTETLVFPVVMSPVYPCALVPTNV